jgi:hypothetical protein
VAEKKTQLVGKGFWTGIGLVVPIGLGMLLGSYFVRYSDGFLRGADQAEAGYESLVTDYTQFIEITGYRDLSQDGKINVLGSLVNKGSEPIGSIKVEAEFFDDKGEFVLERSEYISKKVQPGQTENFQISCGCKDQVVPAYKSITLKVVSAHNF